MVERQDFVALEFSVTDSGIMYHGVGASFDKKTGCDPQLGKSIAGFKKHMAVTKDSQVFTQDICGIPLQIKLHKKHQSF